MTPRLRRFHRIGMRRRQIDALVKFVMSMTSAFLKAYCGGALSNITRIFLVLHSHDGKRIIQIEQNRLKNPTYTQFTKISP